MWKLLLSLFFVDWVLAVPPPIFARYPTFWNQLHYVENQAEPASQIPEEGWSTNPKSGKEVARVWDWMHVLLWGSYRAGSPGHTPDHQTWILALGIPKKRNRGLHAQRASWVGIGCTFPGECSPFSPKTPFVPENHGYACACQNSRVVVWSTPTDESTHSCMIIGIGAPVNEARLKGGSVRDVFFSPDRIIVSHSPRASDSEEVC